MSSDSVRASSSWPCGGGGTVTVLARGPEALHDPADRVDVVAGDATSPDDVAKAVAGSAGRRHHGLGRPGRASAGC
ncbi:hypothetical protein ACIQUU_27020 [Streptomyces sp. NPDC101116]|uniref:hypothetical protein n=1 Tax=Streptomyces sp. NPDC101116 TaxID=3366107 RepID=UPI0037F3E75F